MLTASCSVFSLSLSLSLSLPPRSFSEGAPKEGEGGGRGRAGAVRGQWRGRGKGQGSVGGGHGGRGQGARRGRTFCWNSRVSDLMFEVQGLGFRVQSKHAKGPGFGVEGFRGWRGARKRAPGAAGTPPRPPDLLGRPRSSSFFLMRPNGLRVWVSFGERSERCAVRGRRSSRGGVAWNARASDGVRAFRAPRAPLSPGPTSRGKAWWRSRASLAVNPPGSDGVHWQHASCA